MIQLFKTFNAIVDTSKFTHMLHDPCVEALEARLLTYLGVPNHYAVGFNSATEAITILLKCINNKLGVAHRGVTIPLVIPPVVPNAIKDAGWYIGYNDNVEWVGHSYNLYGIYYNGADHNVIDSAQQLDPGQLKDKTNYYAIFSFYPTKPLGGPDGGMIVTDNKEVADWLRIANRNGTTPSENSWERDVKFAGWKRYMNSYQAYVIGKHLDVYDEERNTIEKVRNIYNNEFNLSRSSYHLYPIMVTHGDTIRTLLKVYNIVGGKHYTPLYKWNNTYDVSNGILIQKSAYVDVHSVSIPMHCGMTEDDATKIAKIVKPFIIEDPK